MSQIHSDLRKQNEHGYTVLHEAVIILVVWGSLDVAKSLAHIESMITQDPGLVDIRDNNGLTAACHAKNTPITHDGHIELLRIMDAKSDTQVTIIAIDTATAINPSTEEAIKSPSNALTANTRAAFIVAITTPHNQQKIEKVVIPSHLFDKIKAIGISKLKEAKDMKDYLIELAIELKDEKVEEASYIINSLIEGRSSTDLYDLIMEGASPEAIAKCIETGQVDVNGRTLRFNTPLHLAVKKGDLEAIKCLLEHGADKDLKNFMGKTPLDKAIKAGNLEIVKYLSDGDTDSGNPEQHTLNEHHEDLDGVLHSETPGPSENE